MRKTAGEPDRREMKRDEKRQRERVRGTSEESWGLGIDNLKLLDGIKELVMQESLYWLQCRLKVVGLACGSYYIIHPLMKFSPHWQFFYSRKSGIIRQCCVCLRTCAFLSPFPNILTRLISLAYAVNHTNTTHSYKGHSDCNELQKHETKNTFSLHTLVKSPRKTIYYLVGLDFM